MSITEAVLLGMVVCLFVAYILIHEKRCRHSESLIQQAEKGDRAALDELMRLDLQNGCGVVLAVQNNRHHEFVYRVAVDSVGHRRIDQVRLTSRPSSAFLKLYLQELRMSSADKARVANVVAELSYHL